LEESYYFIVFAYEIYPLYPDVVFILSWFLEYPENSWGIKREIKKQNLF